jgi:hypothetical protein
VTQVVRHGWAEGPLDSCSMRSGFDRGETPIFVRREADSASVSDTNQFDFVGYSVKDAATFGN